MTAPQPSLAQFLRRASTLHRRATLRRLTLEMFVILGVTVGSTGAFAAFTKRGDVAQSFGLALACGAAVFVTSRAFQRHQRRASTPLRAARTLVRPLREAGHETLARDLVAATEIMRALAHDSVRGSRILGATFVQRVASELGPEAPQLARLILPRRPSPARGIALLVVAALMVAISSPVWRTGYALALHGIDQSPLPAPSVVWRDLEVRLSYPSHTQRAPKTLKNPTGPLKVPAGTRVAVSLVPNDTHEFAWVQWMATRDEASAGDGTMSATALTRDDAGAWSGEWTVRADGRWRVFLDRASSPRPRQGARSPWMKLRVDVDDSPEVQLSARVRREEETTNVGRVEIPFSVRDDFGITEVHLVYETGDGEVHRLPIKGLEPGRRKWRTRYTWDLGSIPLDRRGEVVWWIEARDNDPGLGEGGALVPPGKVGRSSLQQLKILDEEEEHLANLQSLQELRESCVDRLAARLVTPVFTSGGDLDPTARVEGVRAMLQATELLLAQMTALVDRLALDTRVRTRDVETLGEIQQRLAEQFKPQQEVMAELPASELDATPAALRRALARLRRHHSPTIRTFEDEIIRIDDLVDAEILRRFERLLARLETSQRRLTELLGMLAAGDESVLPEVALLRARIRRDTAALNAARALLKRELGGDFMNTEALAGMLRRMEALTIDQKIAEGDYAGALQQAQETLQSLRESGDATRRRLGENSDEASQLSEEEKARVRLLRTLSRLHDEQSRLEQETRLLDARWRANADDKASDKLSSKLQRKRRAAAQSLKKVNDARLSRPGRVGYEDAEIALELLEAQLGGDEAQPLLSLLDQTRALEQAAQTALDGAGTDAPERAPLRRVARLASEMASQVRAELPKPDERLPPDDVEAIQQSTESQGGLRDRTDAVFDSPDARELPAEGADALRRAVQAMKQARADLEQPWLDDSAVKMSKSAEELQRAMDSLRNRQPPPPQSASSTDASTEGSRREGLRKAVLDAMRNRGDDAEEVPVTRFYEELLR